MKPSAVSSKKDALAPFVILMTAYLSLNSVLNLSNKYALVRFLPFPRSWSAWGTICTPAAARSGGKIPRCQCRKEEEKKR